MAGEAADRAFLDGDQHLVLARQPVDQVGVERLGEAGVGDRRRQAVGVELLGRLEAFGEPRAEGEERDLAALAQDAAAADLERHALARASRRRRPRRADSGRTTGRSSMAAAVATMWTSSASSAAAITTKPGRQAR